MQRMKLVMIFVLFFSLCCFAFAGKNVDPECLDMLRAAGRHEEFAELLGIKDVSLVHPIEGRKKEDFMFTNVSALGDILLPSEQEEPARHGIKLNRFPNRKWTNHVIPYEIGKGEFNKTQRDRIRKTLRDLNAMVKNVRIVPRTNQNDYVYVINGRGCYSHLGKRGGQQPLSLQSKGCLRRGTIMHEFMHAMGLMHEQSRYDRDKHVKVLNKNIPRKWRSQYEKSNPKDYDLLGPYDPYSLMHYPMDAPGTGKPAFNFRDSSVETKRVGQRKDPSDKDKKKVDALYS